MFKTHTVSNADPSVPEGYRLVSHWDSGLVGLSLTPYDFAVGRPDPLYPDATVLDGWLANPESFKRHYFPDKFTFPGTIYVRESGDSEKYFVRRLRLSEDRRTPSSDTQAVVQEQWPYGYCVNCFRWLERGWGGVWIPTVEYCPQNFDYLHR